mmetsp:Transcript_10660/g.15908  ORF Transcript_10660/g.15908 Transcript_10660/m.15908 type:complete len:211 (+) Transcript_10660:125-757(+)|eukprot:CAMPEP_0167762492 /NCGR_PEP_ID=MMETSP0110_2-20121227/12801_1 /TAXON_ID=629695 /ORGANISM="Gymnochlora sp., Strain CCMP2014" /LENGTH=210 /DNA_ID=CAMNT_0007649379 /DNA_START=66 /DNA_END=698 /DNA_ORIENTATION=-
MSYQNDIPETEEAKLPTTEVSCLSEYQSPIQACLRPGAWIPGFRNNRYHAEAWNIYSSTEKAYQCFFKSLKDIVERKEGLLGSEKVRVHYSDEKTSRATIYCWTPKAEWLDIMEVSFTKDDTWLGADEKVSNGGCTAVIRSMATGFIPTKCPGAPFWSAILCFVPFTSIQNLEGRTVLNNKQRIRQIRIEMDKSSKIVVTRKTSCKDCCI